MVTKGQTYEEYYGEERAKQIKITQRKSNNKTNLGKTHEEIFGKEQSKKIKKETTKRQKNKTFVEQFGVEKAKEIGQKISKKIKGKNSGTFEERFGIEGAIIEKQKRSIAQKGIKTGPLSKKTKRKISLKKSISKQLIIKEFQKKFDTLNGFCKGEWDDIMFCSGSTIRNKFGSLDALAIEADRQFKKAEKGRFGKNETFILDNIEKENNIRLERQKIINIENNKYFIDGFDNDNNIAYEVDERYHIFRKQKDKIREQQIKEKLGCDIIRINEKNFLSGINHIPLNNFGVITK